MKIIYKMCAREAAKQVMIESMFIIFFFIVFFALVTNIYAKLKNNIRLIEKDQSGHFFSRFYSKEANKPNT